MSAKLDPDQLFECTALENFEHAGKFYLRGNRDKGIPADVLTLPRDEAKALAAKYLVSVVPLVDRYLLGDRQIIGWK